MKKFIGSSEELKELVARAGFDGEWSEHPHSHYRFTSKCGAILNWWDTKKKSVTIQGGNEEKTHFEACLDAALASPDADAATVARAFPVSAETIKTEPKSIFVVHGHDDSAREQLERILLILGLQPFVLQNTSGGGKTIIEALEGQIGKTPEAEFGIVLMTPDDMGYAKRDGDGEIQARARQNLVMEMGMLLSSLTRDRVAILVKGHVELPSDAQGIIYFHFNEHVKEVVPKLTERLRLAGFELDPSAISHAAT